MPILHLIRGPVEGSLDARAEGRFAPCQHRELLHYAGGSIMAHVLIVDSHAGVREQLVRLLEQAGHAATAVATVSEAASMLPTLAPDLLATDAVLTDGSSANLVQQARVLRTKTLMMSGNSDRIIEFEAAGQPYLSKPFQPDLFLKRVEEIVSTQ